MKRGLEKDSEFMSDKEKLRNMIDIAINSADSLKDFSDALDNQFGVTTRITNKTISFKFEDSKQAVRGSRLGDDYTKDALIYRIDKRKKAKSILEAERKSEVARLVAQLDEKTRSEQKKRDPWKELSDMMTEVYKSLDASKRKEEAVRSRFETLVDDEISSKEADITPSVDIQSEANLPPEEYQEPIEFQKSAEEQNPMKTVGKESVVVDDREAVQDSTETVHYDSYVTDDYVSAAISAEADADIELQEIRKPKEWKEEFSDYLKSHPGIVIDEAVEGFGAYYDKLWDDYNSRSNKTIDREIKVKSR